MLEDAGQADPWTQTIHQLSSPAASRLLVEAVIDCDTGRLCADTHAVRWEPFVRLVDRPSAMTATLDWRDATRCCYREQLWGAARARVSGRCAMSGAPICPGDEIFRPRPARPAPRNVSAMILASAIDACTTGDHCTSGALAASAAAAPYVGASD
jgi:hypothetical protein